MIPSSEDVAEIIKRLVDGLVREITRRVEADHKLVPTDVRELVERHARDVLLDWFLGDYLPAQR
jgi:hypothetical protein